MNGTLNTQKVSEFAPKDNPPRNFTHDRKGLTLTTPIPGVMQVFTDLNTQSKTVNKPPKYPTTRVIYE